MLLIPRCPGLGIFLVLQGLWCGQGQGPLPGGCVLALEAHCGGEDEQFMFGEIAGSILGPQGLSGNLGAAGRATVNVEVRPPAGRVDGEAGERRFL